VWRLDYYYDGEYIGDLYPISDDGFKYVKARNAVGNIEFQASLRELYRWCKQHNFDIGRLFTPIRSTIKVVSKDDTSVVGGWLSATPPFSFGANADSKISFNFISWLGLTAGAYIIPPYSYNKRFDLAVKDIFNIIIARTTAAGARWPITYGISDELAVVQSTFEAPKKMLDFLLERTDNTTGTGNFDVYDDPDGVISLHKPYGLDVSDTTIFSYPDNGSKYDVKEISFPAWDNYISDMFLTGAGNGYATVSGFQGAAIFSQAVNNDTRSNTGYFQYAASESDISLQSTLDDRATSYVRETDKPFSEPKIRIDGDPYKIYARDLGGELWVGDLVSVDVVDWVDPLLPIDLPAVLKIDKIESNVDRLGHNDVVIDLVADD
jgi:hypothetical protein